MYRTIIHALTFTLIFAGVPTPADAQTHAMCEGSAIGVEELKVGENFGRSFADGKVILFSVHVDHNLVNSALIGVLHPIPSDLAGADHGQGCTAIYRFDGEPGYFGQVFIDRATATYDPARGLEITLPVWTFQSADVIEKDIVLIVNQSTGDITFK